MMVKVATDKSKSGIVCTVAVWASKMVQSPSENDNSPAGRVSPTNPRLLETLGVHSSMGTGDRAAEARNERRKSELETHAHQETGKICCHMGLKV